MRLIDRFMPLKLAVVTALISLLGACGGERPNDVIAISQQQIDTSLGNIVDQQIIPDIRTFNSASGRLLNTSQNLCELAADQQKPLENLATQIITAQQQWLQLSHAWHRLLPFNIGPLNDNIITPEYLFIDSFRLRGVRYLGQVRNTITDLISYTSAPLTDDRFAALTFNRVGLVALESALHETHPLDDSPPSQQISDIAQEVRDQARKCDVIVGYAKQLDLDAQQLLTQWTVAFTSQNDQADDQGSQPTTPFRERLLGRQLNDDSDPLGLLLTNIQQYLDFIRRRDAVNGYQPLTQQGFATTASSLASIRQFLEGGKSTDGSNPDGSDSGLENSPLGSNNASTPTLIRLIKLSGNSQQVDEINALFDAAFNAIDERNTASLYSFTSELDGKFKREIPDALAIQLGVTFSDGD